VGQLECLSNYFSRTSLVEGK